MMTTVLIIDDSTFIRSQIKAALASEGYEVIGEAENGEQGIDLALELNPDIITLDNEMPDINGIDVLRVLLEQKTNAKVIMVSAVGQQSVVTECLGLGARDYVIKPFSREELTTIVNNVVS